MIGSRFGRLKVGVVGLGRLWEARHKPALAKLKDRFQVTAVYDQVARRAELESVQFGCTAVDGLIELFERPDVEAIYLLTPQWFGLYPIEAACATGKPIYCALPMICGREELDRLDHLVRSSGVVFMPEFARRFYPTTMRLKQLLATKLGAPRLVIGLGRLFGFDRYGQPGPSTQLAPATLLVDPGTYLLDWCRFVFGSEPRSVQGWGGTIFPDPESVGPDFETCLMEFEGGATAQLSVARYHRSLWGDANRFLPQPGVQVFAERGVAWLEMPDRIQWTDADGIHEERLPLEPTVGELLNDHFYQMVRGEGSLAPTWNDSIAVARLLGAIRRSGLEGQKVATDSSNQTDGTP
ncbi:Gfo/Idh/MocA family protein [Tundrisphaera lichenicola]|uniref:Gfo/Idh/MocA family protein n=1 Tax=Tundrisphaera lichenicola TaxID=2029860 RepID=UPI003EBEC8A1